MRVRAWATFSGSSLDHPVQTSFFLKKKQTIPHVFIFRRYGGGEYATMHHIILIFYAGIDRVKVSNSNSFLPDLI
jgi:hypothetical protein